MYGTDAIGTPHSSSVASKSRYLPAYSSLGTSMVERNKNRYMHGDHDVAAINTCVAPILS